VSQQVVVFRLGNEKFATDIASVTDIVRLAPISSLPQMPSYVDGVLNLRGKVTLIGDLRKRLGVATAEHTTTRALSFSVLEPLRWARSWTLSPRL
jgi:purine-binding chemotaxis protein CheW